MIVRIVKDWNRETPMFRQTPNNDGIWEDIQFTFEDIERCDYLIVCNRPPYDLKVNCPEGHKWLISMEPPIEEYSFCVNSFKYFDKIFTQRQNPVTKNLIFTHGSLPWHIDVDYKDLMNLDIGTSQQLERISFVTSNLRTTEGHRRRQKFFDFMRNQNMIEIDYYGRGINEVENKFDALYPYKYSIAIESCSYDNYWTEKLADCFLSWTMPIYYGAPNITDYFPKESIIMIDLSNPNDSINTIMKALHEDKWSRNLEYLKIARDLVLNKYQFFPRMVSEIKNNKKFTGKNNEVFIPSNLAPWEVDRTIIERLYNKIKRRIAWKKS